MCEREGTTGVVPQAGRQCEVTGGRRATRGDGGRGVHRWVTCERKGMGGQRAMRADGGHGATGGWTYKGAGAGEDMGVLRGMWRMGMIGATHRFAWDNNRKK